MNWPDKIQNIRLGLDESQTLFGNRFGVSHAAVSDWESGKSEAPYKVIDFVVNIMEEIGVDEEENYAVNDTMRSIRRVSEYLKKWDSDLADPRIKAMILTKLEEAELLSQRLIKPSEASATTEKFERES